MNGLIYFNYCFIDACEAFNYIFLHFGMFFNYCLDLWGFLYCHFYYIGKVYTCFISLYGNQAHDVAIGMCYFYYVFYC